MSDTPVPPRPRKQFLGRDFIAPPPSSKIRDDAAAAAAAPAAPGATGTLAPPPAGDTTPPAKPPASPLVGPDAWRPRVATDRDVLFQRYADLRQKLADSPHDVTLLAEAAEAAETLSLTIEAMELWRECMRVDPMHLNAPQRIAALDRRAAATGETGGEQKSTYRAREQAPESPPFWTDLGSVLSYPFRGRGFGVFVGASIFFAVGEVLATFNVFFGWFVMLCLLGYLAAWHFDVVSRSAAGKDDPPEFPELITIIDSCVMPFLGLLACVLFSFAPMLILLALTIQGTLSPAVGGIGMLLSIVPCGFVFPMSLSVRALTQSAGDAMSPSRVYGSIGRVLPDYVIAFAALCALWFGWSIVRVGVLFAVGFTFGLPTADAVLHLDYLRIVGWLLYTALVWPLLLYVWCVQGHVLGCLYRQSYRRLAWFVPASADTARAKRFSAAVALAGAGGAVLLAGGGWLTYLLWPGARANTILSGSSVPVAAGSKLAYYWENSDGPAGLVTYTFTDGGEGKLGVVADYLHAGDWGVTASKGPVGIIDVESGTVLRGDGEEAGLRLAEKSGRHTRFFGPKRGSLNSTYLNDWSVRGDARFKNTWETWRVVDPDTSTELYYDKSTGVLVGRKFVGVGFTVTEWLTEAPGVPGIGPCPAPNRKLDVSKTNTMLLPGDGLLGPDDFGLPPLDLEDR